MRVLLTRPARESEASAKRLAARGHEAMLAPVMGIVATGCALPKGTFEGVLATSAHAIDLLEDSAVSGLRDLPLYVVGGRTLVAAHARGFRNAGLAQRDVEALIATVVAEASTRSHFLYLAGADRKPGLEAALTNANHHVETVVVYAALAETQLPEETIVALRDNRIDAVLHFSRRSAALLLQLARAAGVFNTLIPVTHICISQDAAAPLLAAGLAARVATRPDSEAMFDVLEKT